MNKTHVEGNKKCDILVYALSTCVWCRKTKNLLNTLGVDYYFIDVDLLEGAEKEKIFKEMKHWNPAGSFPTIVIDNKRCIAGYDEERIRKELGL